MSRMRPFGKFSREANVEGFQDVEVPARRSRQLEAIRPAGVMIDAHDLQDLVVHSVGTTKGVLGMTRVAMPAAHHQEAEASNSRAGALRGNYGFNSVA